MGGDDDRRKRRRSRSRSRDRSDRRERSRSRDRDRRRRSRSRSRDRGRDRDERDDSRKKAAAEPAGMGPPAGPPPSKPGLGPPPGPPPAEDVSAAAAADDDDDYDDEADGKKSQPMDLEELVRRRNEQIEKSNKPKFLTKAQRAEEAMRRRADEVKAQRNRQKSERDSRSTFARAAAAGTSDRGREGAYADSHRAAEIATRELDKQKEALRMQYLGESLRSPACAACCAHPAVVPSAARLGVRSAFAAARHALMPRPCPFRRRQEEEEEDPAALREVSLLL